MHMHLYKTRGIRLVAALATVGLATVGLVGCSSSSTPASSATSGTINWWGWTPELAIANAYIKSFNKVYPNIKVNFKQLTINNYVAAMRPALASSSGPDVFDIQPGSDLTDFGGDAIDLTPVVKSALGNDWQSKVSPIGIKDLTTTSGKLAALSVGSTYGGPLWINEALYKKYNLTPPTTLAEWVKDCATFKANGVGCFVQGAAQEGFDQDTLQAIADSVQPGLWTKASTGAAKWSSPGIVKTFAIWKKLFTDNIMQEGAVGAQQYPDANNAFLSGKYATVNMGSWYVQYASIAGMKNGISAAGVGNPVLFPLVPIPFPDVAGTGHSGALFGDSDFGLAINAKSKVKAAATTFVKWLTTSVAGQQQVANQLADIPALDGIAPDWSTIALPFPAEQKAAIQKLVKQAGSVTEARESLLTSPVQTAIGVAATTVAAGQATPAQAAATLQAAAVASGEKFK